ncbi:MAG TPA: lyase family protein, partial [Chloroflexota bacterium]
MWGGRFEKSLDERALRYTTSLPVDRRLFEWDVLGSIAHARMLGQANIIPAEDAAMLVDGLSQLLRTPPPLDGPYEDIHSLVEAELAQRVGPAAGRLHTARSRNDQVATDARLFCRAALIEGVAHVVELQSVLLEVAQQHTRTI